jgi:hypothetical protein
MAAPLAVLRLGLENLDATGFMLRILPSQRAIREVADWIQGVGCA